MATTNPYRTLKRWIYSGRLQPGERLIETDLAKRIGVSRIPLRESLRRLEAEGLVRSIPNTATFVEKLSPEDIQEIFFMRLLLEPPAARLAALHAKPGVIATLRRLARRMGRAAKEDNYRLQQRLDHQFHRTIVKASGCQRLLRAYESCHILITGVHINYQDARWETDDSIETLHTDLVDQIESRRPDDAEAIARRTLERSIKVIDDYFAKETVNCGDASP